MHRIRRILLVVTFLLAMVGATALMPASASADGVKYYTYYATDVYISVVGGRVNGYIRVIPEVGSADYYYVSATVYVVQCHTDRTTGCGTYISTPWRGRSNIVSSSSKPALLGHAYKACSSFTMWEPILGVYRSWTNVCSPWATYP